MAVASSDFGSHAVDDYGHKDGLSRDGDRSTSPGATGIWLEWTWFSMAQQRAPLADAAKVRKRAN